MMSSVRECRCGFDPRPGTLTVAFFTCPFSSLGHGMRALLERLRWDNRAIASLPLDPITDNYVRTVPRACFSLVSPTPLKGPALVAHSQVGQSGWLSVTRALHETVSDRPPPPHTSRDGCFALFLRCAMYSCAGLGGLCALCGSSAASVCCGFSLVFTVFLSFQAWAISLEPVRSVVLSLSE